MRGNLSFGIAVMCIALILIALISYSHHDRIEQYVKEQNGQVVEVQHKVFDRGPFHWYEAGKNISFYRVVYEVNGQTKVVWVRFGGFKAKWRQGE